MALFPIKKTMTDIVICEKCKDWGYLENKTSQINRQGLVITHIQNEVCPYCMPTNKYGNLQKKLKLLADQGVIYKQLPPPKLDSEEK